MGLCFERRYGSIFRVYHNANYDQRPAMFHIVSVFIEKQFVWKFGNLSVQVSAVRFFPGQRMSYIFITCRSVNSIFAMVDRAFFLTFSFTPSPPRRDRICLLLIIIKINKLLRYLGGHSSRKRTQSDNIYFLLKYMY